MTAVEHTRAPGRRLSRVVFDCGPAVRAWPGCATRERRSPVAARTLADLLDALDPHGEPWPGPLDAQAVVAVADTAASRAQPRRRGAAPDGWHRSSAGGTGAGRRLALHPSDRHARRVAARRRASGCPTCTSPSRTRRPTARGWSRPSRSTCCRCGSTRSSHGPTWCWSPPPIAVAERARAGSRGAARAVAPGRAPRRRPSRRRRLRSSPSPPRRPRTAGRGLSRSLARRAAGRRRRGPRRGPAPAPPAGHGQCLHGGERPRQRRRAGRRGGGRGARLGGRALRAGQAVAAPRRHGARRRGVRRRLGA